MTKIAIDSRPLKLCVNCHTTVDQPSHNSRPTVTQQRGSRHTRWVDDGHTYKAKTTGVVGVANVFFTKKLADMKRKAYIC